MSKMKTPKAIAKRFEVTGRKKVMKRKAGQDHFNAKESGNVTRMKRRDISASKSLADNVKKLINQ